MYEEGEIKVKDEQTKATRKGILKVLYEKNLNILVLSYIDSDLKMNNNSRLNLSS